MPEKVPRVRCRPTPPPAVCATILVERDGRQRDWYTVLIGWDMDRLLAFQAAEDYKAIEPLPAIVRELAPL